MCPSMSHRLLCAFERGSSLLLHTHTAVPLPFPAQAAACAFLPSRLATLPLLFPPATRQVLQRPQLLARQRPVWDSTLRPLCAPACLVAISATRSNFKSLCFHILLRLHEPPSHVSAQALCCSRTSASSTTRTSTTRRTRRVDKDRVPVTGTTGPRGLCLREKAQQPTGPAQLRRTPARFFSEAAAGRYASAKTGGVGQARRHAWQKEGTRACSGERTWRETTAPYGAARARAQKVCCWPGRASPMLLRPDAQLVVTRG